jgi:hypothetical protein
MGGPDLELMLFERSPQSAREVLPFGIGSFMLDWEYLGKTERQHGFDTEVEPVGVAELAAVAAVPGVAAWCRINHDGPHTADEIEFAIGAGACGIFLPMVTEPGEVERFLRRVDGRCGVGILVETARALACVDDMAGLPLDRVYFGLNDFAICRGRGSIFGAVLDRSVERAREAFADTPFGFGGVTAIDAGSPVPCRRLIEEMARLDCRFSFLRRSYRRDVQRIGVPALVEGVRAYWRRCRARSRDDVDRDRRALEQLLREVCDER